MNDARSALQPRREIEEKSIQAVEISAGKKVKTDSICFDTDSFQLLRYEMSSCQRLRIDYDELNSYTQQLMATKLDHKPFWQQWFVKLPFAIGIGALAGWGMGKKTDDPAVAGLIGGLAAGVTMTLFEINW